MIRYDWQVLRVEPISRIMKVINALSSKGYMRGQEKSTLKVISSFVDSTTFLLNPEDLILNYKKYSESEVFYYLEIASFRGYIDYKLENSGNIIATLNNQDVFRLTIKNL